MAAVVAYLVLRPVAGPQYEAMNEQGIGENVAVSGNSVPTSISARKDGGASPGFKLMRAVGPVVEITPAGLVTSPVTLTFSATSKIIGTDTVLIATAQTRTGPWTLVKPTKVSPDGTKISVTATHLSWWQPLVMAIADVADTFKKTVLDEATGDLTATASPPHCDNEQQARQDDYQITSSAKDTLFWCFGVEGGKRVLKIVNRMRYPLQVRHPGFSVLSAGKIMLSLDQLARLGSGDTTVLYPFDEADLAVDLTPGTTALVSTALDGWAQSLYQIDVGVTTLINILTRFGAGAGTISNGAITRTEVDEVVEKVHNLLGDKDCLQAVLDVKPTAVLGACFDADELYNTFGWAGFILAPLMAAGQLAEYFRSELDSLGDQLNGRSQYQITLTRADPEKSFQPLVGSWVVHGGGFTIRADHTGTQFFSIGPCSVTLPQTPYCNQVMTYRFTISGTVVTGVVTALTYQTWEGGPPPAGFAPLDDGGGDKVGSTFTFRKAAPDLVAQTDRQGNVANFCDPHGPSVSTGICGA